MSVDHPHFVTSKAKRRALFFGILVILLFSSVARANDFEGLRNAPWMADVPCKDNLERQSIVALGGASVICYEFDAKELTPSSQLTLTIAIYSPKGQSLIEVDSLVVVDTESYPGVTVTGKTKLDDVTKNLTTRRPYRYDLTLDKTLKPELYKMKLTVSLKRREDYVTFKLPMGAAGGDWLESTPQSQNSIECWSGATCSPVNLVFLNKLPYELIITQTSIFSEPGDLLHAAANTSVQKLKKGPSPQPVSLTATAQRMSSLRALRGLTIPKAQVHITYQDQHGREFLTTIPLALEVRPNFILLTVVLVSGAIIGTLIRLDLRRLRKAGVITRKQQIKFAVYTCVSGLFVCLIALFANVKLVAFADQSTYSAWDPRMLFFTSLIGTIGGIPLLYARLKLPSAPESNSEQVVGGNQPKGESGKEATSNEKA